MIQKKIWTQDNSINCLLKKELKQLFAKKELKQLFAKKELEQLFARKDPQRQVDLCRLAPGSATNATALANDPKENLKTK